MQAPYRFFRHTALRLCVESALASLHLLFARKHFIGLLASWTEEGGVSLGGDSRVRTGDLLLARQALSQLSYIPSYLLKGLYPLN